MPSEVNNVFNYIKQKLISTMHGQTDKLLQQYITIRTKVKEFESGKKKGIGFAESRQVYNDFRKIYDLSTT